MKTRWRAIILVVFSGLLLVAVALLALEIATMTAAPTPNRIEISIPMQRIDKPRSEEVGG